MSEPLQSDAQTWALIIGIDTYPFGESVSGACKDVDCWHEYLTTRRHVPEDHIVILKNSDATRARIIEEFQRHLIRNPRIRKYDSLIFHFSGHGTRKPAPRSWPEWWYDGGSEHADDERKHPHLEMIVPFDCVGEMNRSPMLFFKQRPRSGIPDRTLASLLRKAAAAHGNNITVSLDSCHSGNGTRGNVPDAPDLEAFTVRGIDAGRVGDLESTTDLDIWADDPQPLQLSASQAQVGFRRAASADTNRNSHVLMAACSRHEDAVGSDTGGWFTQALISALNDFANQAITYAQLHAEVTRRINQRRGLYAQVDEDHQPPEQKPTCEGLNRDREVFKISGVDPRHFGVKSLPRGEAGERLCQIEAGDVQGVKPGTTFTIHIVEGQISTMLGTAVAVSNEWNYCTAKLADNLDIPSDKNVQAMIATLADPLRVALVNDMPESEEAVGIMKRLRRRLQLVPEGQVFFVVVEDTSSPDVILHVDDTTVFPERLDPFVRELNCQLIRMPHGLIEEVFPELLATVAKFNLYLHQDSPTHPFAEKVDICLHRLIPIPERLDGECQIDGPPVEFLDDEATVTHDPDAIYGLVLHNRSEVPLFPYVFWYDPSTCSIETFYEPLDPMESPLRAGGQLQVGGSPECMAAMSLVVKEDGEKDSGFLKIILARAPMSFRFMVLKGVVEGEGEDGDGPLKYVTERNEGVRAAVEDSREGGDGEEPVPDGPQPVQGQWDTLLRKITVLPITQPSGP